MNEGVAELLSSNELLVTEDEAAEAEAAAGKAAAQAARAANSQWQPGGPGRARGAGIPRCLSCCGGRRDTPRVGAGGGRRAGAGGGVRVGVRVGEGVTRSSTRRSDKPPRKDQSDSEGETTSSPSSEGQDNAPIEASAVA